MALTHPEFQILNSLRTASNATQREIARETELSLGVINKNLRELQLKGLVKDSELTEAGLQALEPYRVKHAIILAAGLSSRFAPLSYERPKGLLKARGEVMIERQIRQLQEAGITDITIVVGYMAELFFYLEDKFGVKIVVNPDYATKNNTSSIYRVRDRISNAYICSSDNYFTVNPFEPFVYRSYYSAVYQSGKTDEWCMTTRGKQRLITKVTIGGENAWVMLGPAYWDDSFATTFRDILEKEFPKPATDRKLWEHLYIEHLPELPMTMKPYTDGAILEFDSLTEMQDFDPEFMDNVDSRILDNITQVLGCERSEITDFYPIKTGITNLSCHFAVRGEEYVYRYPGLGTEKMINRQNELQALHLARDLGLDSTFIQGDPKTGWKISRFIPNARNLDPHDQAEVAQAMQLARRLHTSGATLLNSFDFYQAGLGYEELFFSLNAPIPHGYDELKQKITTIYEYTLADDSSRCICHNDFFHLNLLVDEDANISLIDWEYAGMGDEANDFGTFCVCCQLAPDEIENALEAYFGRKPSLEERRHYWAHIVLAGWCWYVWALAKEAQGGNVGEWLYIYYSYARKFAQKVLNSYESSEQ